MLDLKAHLFRGRSFHVLVGAVIIPIMLAIAAVTAARFFLNAVFAFAISSPGPAADQARVPPGPVPASWSSWRGVAPSASAWACPR